MNEFKNRESNKLNRKRYVIEEVKEDGLGTIEEFIAYETRYDDKEDSEVTEEGTRLDAESLNQVVNYLAEQKTNEILQEKESELEEKINELTEQKVYDTLKAIEDTIDNLVESHSIITNTKVNFELSNALNEDVSIRWEVLEGEGVELSKDANSTLVSVSREAEDKVIKLKAIYSHRWIEITKVHSVTVIGYIMAELVQDEVIIDWMRGTTTNDYEFEIKTTDNSPITLNPTVLSGNSNEQYINVTTSRKAGCERYVYEVTLEETEKLKTEPITQPLVFESMWNVYVGDTELNAKKELKVKITYYPTSNTPED